MTRIVVIAVLEFISLNAYSGYVDGDFKIYLTEIKRDIRNNCARDEYSHKHFQFIYKDLEKRTVGLCLRTRSHFTVFVNPHTWPLLTFDEKYQVLAHEVTHCMLRLPHVDDPNNYMYPIQREFLSKGEVRSQFLKNIYSVCQGQPTNILNGNYKYSQKKQKPKKHCHKKIEKHLNSYFGRAND